LSVDAAHVRFVYTHAFAEHVSIVHALLSSHNAAISADDLSIVSQPVASLHTGFLQMSLDVHAAPKSVTSHEPAGLHVYSAHAVFSGHGSSGFR
jgi:hypothetical protein